MIVNGSDIIKRQLSIEEETRIDFDGKHHTVLNPVRFTPEPEGARLSLDGEWQVKYYPFKGKAIAESTKSWKTVQQPGKALCFHGGVDTQHIMNEGSTDDVKNEVRKLIGQLGPNGYIVAPSHTLQADVPPENIVALYEMIVK